MPKSILRAVDQEGLVDNPELEEKYTALQVAFEALSTEFDKCKHLAGTPQIELKLAIFDKLPMPVWACDRDCKIVFWNDGAARLYQYSSEEVLGKDFVNLFVNPPERDKARADCIEIIDQNKPWKNMADDIDKHGNTQKLVTHCFPIYDIAGHAGLQVEISYEAQDYDKLSTELAELHAASKRQLDKARDRAEEALKDGHSAERARLRDWESDIRKAELQPSMDKKSIEATKIDHAEKLKRLIAWEKKMRLRLASASNLDEFDLLTEEIENREGLDV
jgi:PAS domain S-box-containing protein